MEPVIEGFDRLQRIAVGGSATVYRAFQPTFGRWVAIKVFDREASVDRFSGADLERESRLVGRLTDHPHVVTVFEAGVTDGGAPYLAMAYFEGGSLADRLAEGGSSTPEEVAAMGIRLASALESAHRHGFLHGDVKPANVVFNRFGEPALTDFGAGTVADGEAAVLQGYTPAFVAPEVRDGLPVRSASDVYGLGRTLRAALGDEPAGDLGPLLERMVADRPDARPSLDEVIAGLIRAEELAGRPPTSPVLTGPRRDDHGIERGPDDVPTISGVARPPVGPRPAASSRGIVASLVAAVVVIVLIVAVVAAIVAVTRSDDPAVAGATGRQGTTTTTTTVPTDAVVHPDGVADRSPELQAGLDGLTAKVQQLTGGAPLATGLPVSAYFPPRVFPDVAPLPARSRWFFTAPDDEAPPCDSFWSEPVTVDGFAGGVAAVSTAIVSVATYSLADVDEATTFFGGRSLALGPESGACTGGVGAPKTVRSHEVDLDADDLGVAVDELNTWWFDAPGPLGEDGAYGIAARTGRQIFEIRVAVLGGRRFEPGPLAAFATAVIADG